MSISDFGSAASLAGPAAMGAASSIALPTSASALTSAGLGLVTGSAFRHLGLSMRFNVTVDGWNLGHWTSCEGLKVEFEYETVISGGDYATPHYLPKAVKFEAVTLKRAVESPYSAAVQQWLALVAQQWKSGGEPTGTTVLITLMDVFQDLTSPAASWQLTGAFPKSWSGPSLDAKKKEIATETLVLAHRGFLVAAPPVPSLPVSLP
jgi:phage tail-like protein